MAHQPPFPRANGRSLLTPPRLPPPVPRGPEAPQVLPSRETPVNSRLLVNAASGQQVPQQQRQATSNNHPHKRNNPPSAKAPVPSASDQLSESSDSPEPTATRPSNPIPSRSRARAASPPSNPAASPLPPGHLHDIYDISEMVLLFLFTILL